MLPAGARKGSTKENRACETLMERATSKRRGTQKAKTLKNKKSRAARMKREKKESPIIPGERKS